MVLTCGAALSRHLLHSRPDEFMEAGAGSSSSGGWCPGSVGRPRDEGRIGGEGNRSTLLLVPKEIVRKEMKGKV